ncbi:MAG: hypothetical protein ACI3V0_11700 [Faecousia sp.]
MTKSKKGSLGYTLTELLVVIGILAVLCAIAIPSIITISRALKFRQRNDYAKTIFLAAQENLTEMRSDGSLKMIWDCIENNYGAGNEPHVSGCSDFPAETWTDQYFYVTTDETALYSLVLPVNSVESTLRNQQVIIEFNRYNGNVYAVFYSEEEEDIFSLYKTAPGLPRNDAAARRSMMLGYYDGSGLANQELELEQTKAELEYVNGEEGVIKVRIPMPDEFYGKFDEFMSALSVELTITGDTSNGSITIPIKTAEDPNIETASTYNMALTADATKSGNEPYLDIDGKTVVVEYILDSLATGGSFADKVIADENVTSLTQVKNEAGFIILPGENVTVTANVSFTAENTVVEVESGILPGINPLFEYLEPSMSPNTYVLAVSNGRNLQNLNVIAPSVASRVEAVTFTADVNWNETVKYYNDAYGKISSGESSETEGRTTTDKLYSNTDEAPARCLPYFVPISNDALFGSATFTYGTVGTIPTMQDTHDAYASGGNIRAVDHADIVGNGNRVIGLNIDATKYADQTAFALGEGYYVSNNYTDANGTTVTNNQDVNYYFTGLFAYANTQIDGLKIVNSVVKGHPFATNVATATGSLLGASGFNSLITNCGVYIDKNAADYQPTQFIPTEYKKDDAQTWYGVSGEGAVGGLVGYAKSHRTASGDLTDDTSELAFSDCFAAVPVSGNMRSSESVLHGFTNGVGGFIGNSNLTNFYNCYSSGNVYATGCYVREARHRENSMDNGFISGIINQILPSNVLLNEMLKYDGYYSTGAGGFVGTSHGTRYTNCFTTGDVNGTGKANAGAGGFVGVMCYDERFVYEADNTSKTIRQLTVFDSCYSTGKATINNDQKENFSGANARIFKYDGSFYADYYELLAPYHAQYGKAPAYPSATNDNMSYSDNGAYYIYKDSYYLSRNYSGDEGINTSSVDCASPASYDMLANIHTKHADEDWLKQRVNHLGGYRIGLLTEWLNGIRGVVISNDYRATYEEFFDAKTQLFSGSVSDFLNLNEAVNRFIRNTILAGKPDQYWTSVLTGVYKTQLFEGFSRADWTYASSASTHPYRLNGGTYPFSRFNGMVYYGDWPSRPLTCGIGYYEKYDVDGKDSYGIFLDGEESSTIQNRTVVSDGYAIMTANKGDTVTVQVEGAASSHSLTSKMMEDYVSNGKTYTVFPLTMKIMEEAAAAVKVDNFYVRISVKVKTENGDEQNYILYFNPNAAKTNLNPVYGNSTTDPVDAVPDQILIRSARQLAALGSASHSWGEGYNYVQEMNIDFASYTASSYKETGAAAAICTAIADADPIGTTEQPFNASYNGKIDAQSKAAVTRTVQTGDTVKTDSLFGVIGETGSVQNLIVNAGIAGKTVTMGSNNADAVGIVANVVNGTLNEIDLMLAGPVTVTAKENAGLLAGKLGGTLKNSDVISETTAAVQATNAGGAVGASEGATTITGCTINFTKPLSLTGTHCGGFVGSGIGSAENVTVTLNGLTANVGANGFAGGFAGILSGTTAEGGTIQKSTVTSCAVTLNGTTKTAVSEGATSGNGSILGGFAGSVENAAITASSVTLSDRATLEAPMAAGFVGKTATDAEIQNTQANVRGNITGTNSAAGFAGTMESGSSFSLCNANIAGVVTAPNAAGFAVNAGGSISNCLTVLNSGTIKGNTTAAGFAGTVTGSVYLSSGVAGSGTITAPTAAGFAGTISGKVSASRVTPASAQTSAAYVNSGGYGKLCITGTTAAAGFANTVEAAASVQNCDALGTISGAAVSGFAGTNAGTIDGCMANVVVSGGVPFVTSNSGTISFCYGWFRDGSKETSLENFKVPGTCRSSYFADLDVPVAEEGGSNSVLVYDSKGAVTAKSASELLKTEALDTLNGSSGKWRDGKTFKAYPFSTTLTGKGYPFPMLRAHSGDWVVTPQYAFGVIYYEQDNNGNLSFHAVDLSDPEQTVEKKSLSVDWKENNANSDISTAGYAIFCKNVGDVWVVQDGKQVSNGIGNTNLETLAAAFKTRSGAKETYNVYPLTAEGVLNVCGANENIVYEPDEGEGSGEGDVAYTGVRLVTWYADAFNVKDNTYTIRTGEQFSNIREMFDQKFEQTHKVTLPEGYKPMESFSGTFNGNGCTISAGTISCLINEVSGNITGMNLTATNATGSIFGTVAEKGTVTDSTISVGTTNSSLIDTVSGTVKNSFIYVTTANVSSDVTKFGVVASEVTSTGKLLGNTVVDDVAHLTPVKVTGKGNATIGGIAAVNNGTISGGYSNVSIDYTAVENGSAIIGGVVGANTGSIAGVSATSQSAFATIAYTQNGTDSATIGGLVGQMAGGHVSDINVSASVNLIQSKTASTGSYFIGGLVGQMDGGLVGKIQPDQVDQTEKVVSNINVSGSVTLSDSTENGTGTSYTVGGAIGRDNSTVSNRSMISAVTSTVTVDRGWADTDASQTGCQDMGNGPVGMFVGYVSSGSFVNCSSDVESNTTYQFLGQVAAVRSELPPADSYGLWFSHAESDADKYSDKVEQNTDLDDYAENKGFDISWNGGDSYLNCNAQLTNCTFKYGNVQYTQAIDVKYFYQGQKTTEAGGDQLVKAEMTISYDQGSTVKYSDLYKGNNPVQNQETQYYYKLSDNSYKPVTVTVSKNGNSNRYTYQLEYDNGNGTYATFLTKNNVRDRNSTITDDNGQEITLYKGTSTLSDGMYVITNSTGTIMFNGRNSSNAESLNLNNPDSWTRWTKTGNTWKSGDNTYLYLYKSVNGYYNYLVYTSAEEITVSKYGNGFSLWGYNRYLSYNGSYFSLANNPSEIGLWKVVQKDDVYACVFTIAPDVTETLCVVMKDNKVVTLPLATAALYAEETPLSADETTNSSGTLAGGETGNTEA